MNPIGWWRTGYSDPEINEIVAAIRNERLSQGAITTEFERCFAERIGSRHAIATTSGSVALYLALKGHGIGPGDEVIVPDRTWVATAHAVLLAGASVRLVDVCADCPIMSAEAVEAAISPATKALLPVHLNGRACYPNQLKEIAARYGIALIEDACQAMVSRFENKYLGTFGSLGCFSLGVTKLITTAQGGVLVTDDDDLDAKIRLIRNHGVIDNFTEAWAGFGFNFKFTDIQAAAGLAQLQRIEKRTKHVCDIYNIYKAELSGAPGISIIPVNILAGELPLYTEVLADNRDGLIAALRQIGIQARPMPPSLHTSPYFGNTGDYPCSRRFAAHGMYLPCGPEQPLENVERVIMAIRAFASGKPMSEVCP